MEVTQGNTKTVTITITSGLSSLSGYTAYFTVKNKAGVQQFQNEGSILGLAITHTITATENDLDPDTYEYEATIDDGTNKHTLDGPDEYIVKRSIVF